MDLFPVRSEVARNWGEPTLRRCSCIGNRVFGGRAPVPYGLIASKLLSTNKREEEMMLQKLLREEDGQDIAEYAVMLAVILVLVIGTIRLIGSNANNAFSAVANSM